MVAEWERRGWLPLEAEGVLDLPCVGVAVEECLAAVFACRTAA